MSASTRTHDAGLCLTQLVVCKAVKLPFDADLVVLEALQEVSHRTQGVVSRAGHDGDVLEADTFQGGLVSAQECS